MRQKTPNARFWYWHNGEWTKLTLEPGQSFDLAYGGPTEEGFEARYITFRHEGDRVEVDHLTRGRDCDGRYEQGGVAVCPLDRLRARTSDDGQPCPEWVREDEYQRDHAAEAMGY